MVDKGSKCQLSDIIKKLTISQGQVNLPVPSQKLLFSVIVFPDN